MSPIDRKAAERRLRLASATTDLTPEHREILCQIIQAELDGTLAGCYADVPIQVYHHPLCSGYSSTTIKRIVEQSYNHWFVTKDTNSRALRFGSAFHAFCNEPHVFANEYVVLPFDDRRSAEFKDAKEKVGNKIIILNPEFRAIEAMSRKLLNHPDAAPFFTGSQFELTYFSKDAATGLWKKCRTDIKKGNKAADLKTCMNASMLAFAYDAKKFLYRISGSYYLEIITEVEESTHRDFILIPCEKVDPWEAAVYRVDDSSLDRAQTEIRNALGIIRNVLDQGDSAWGGYQLGIKDIAI